MPFIHIKSLEFEEPADLQPLVEGISRDFSRDLDMAIEHVTVIWEYLMPGAYAVAGQAADLQPRNSHPVLVDVLVPDFNTAESMEKMLLSVSRSISG